MLNHHSEVEFVMYCLFLFCFLVFYIATLPLPALNVFSEVVPFAKGREDFFWPISIALLSESFLSSVTYRSSLSGQ